MADQQTITVPLNELTVPLSDLQVISPKTNDEFVGPRLPPPVTIMGGSRQIDPNLVAIAEAAQARDIEKSNLANTPLAHPTGSELDWVTSPMAIGGAAVGIPAVVRAAATGGVLAGARAFGSEIWPAAKMIGTNLGLKRLGVPDKLADAVPEAMF